MSPTIFTTDPDSPYSVEIAGVGVLGGSAHGGIPVERASQVVRELQDEGGKPLTGKRLEDAARAFADARGIATKTLKSIDEEKLRVEGGAFPAGLTIEEISRQASERDRGSVAVHDEPVETESSPQEPPTVPDPSGKEG